MKQNHENFNHKISEQKWQKAWQDSNIFKFDENSQKPKYYVLEMFPYPSGKIHMGHLRNYAIGDVIARFKMMKGFNVLHPMGFDSFGLPAENAALEHKIHPKDWTLKNIEIMRQELKSIGLSLDWNRELATCLPDYFKHEQKIFIDFVKNGLAYQKESYVNWDPVDQTVLANEQVIEGRGWRSGALVEKKKLKQWFLKVSEFSEDLLQDLKTLSGWDERVLSMQEKWIGKSEGLKLKFDLDFEAKRKDQLCQEKLAEIIAEFPQIEIYTTRPDTIFGASFVAISPQSDLAIKLGQRNEKIQQFLGQCNKNLANEEAFEKQEKLGIFTDIKADHPFKEGEKLDVYIANFVLMDYGTGAVFGCPAHDERDFEFAKKYHLPIKKVVTNLDEFLVENDIVNFSDPSIQKLSQQLKSESKDEYSYVKACFEFVRDKIEHVMDRKKYHLEKPLLIASEVLEAGYSFCFGKATLFAALLRAENIPCGFSDQILCYDEEKQPDRKIIHNVNSVYFRDLKKWIRLDVRGNRPKDSNSEFSLGEEILAYKVYKDLEEIDNLGAYANLPQDIIFYHENYQNNEEMIKNLPNNSMALLVNEPFLEDGIMINSDFLDGISNNDAKEKIIKLAEEKNIGVRQINYRLRDWGISRQRYWGCPIPMLYLENGEVVPEKAENLPVELPEDVTFDGQGNPLTKHQSWKNTIYVDENGVEHKAIRETDTFDTFFESSWYFLRYISAPDDQPFDRDLVNKFMPVDQYIGGVEHAVLHLLYARFFVKALKKCGYLNFDEPFKNLTTQGMVCHQTFKTQDNKFVFPHQAIEKEKNHFIHEETGEEIIVGRSEKMSKSKKNVVEPARIIESYGADTARLFMLSDSPVNRDLEWSEAGIDGAWRYINRIYKLVSSFVAQTSPEKISEFNSEINHNSFSKKDDLNNLSDFAKEIVILTHKIIADVDSELEKMGFNRAIAKIREFSNALEKFVPQNELDQKVKFFSLKTLSLLISPIMPHLSEEIFAQLGSTEMSCVSQFPDFVSELIIDENVKIAVQVLGKLRSVIEVAKDSTKQQIEELAKNDEKVLRFLENKEIKKVIYVPNKLLNFVVI